MISRVSSTRTDEELDRLVLCTKVPEEISFDFLNHSQELKHPTAIEWQKKIPEKYRFYSSLVLSFLYDDKLFNLDTERFKRVRVSLICMILLFILVTGANSGYWSLDLSGGF